MNGRLWAERLLATTSVAALVLSFTQQAADAACTTIAAGASLDNTSALSCVTAPNSSVSITNEKSGTIGPPGSAATPAIQVTGTLSGGIVNSGSISIAPTSGSPAAVFVSGSGLIQGGITNSGTISVTSTTTGTNYGAIALGGGLGISAFAGGITNSGTLSVNIQQSSDQSDLLSTNVSTFSGNIVNTGTIAGVFSNSGGNVSVYGVSLGGSIFNGGLTNAGTITVGLTGSAGNDVTGHAIAVTAATFTGSIVNSGSIALTATGQALALDTGMAIDILGGSVLSGGIVNSGMISVSATNSGTSNSHAIGINLGGASFSGGLTNSGAITATAKETGAANASANGVELSTSTFSGTILNSGTISATATGSSGAQTTGVSIAVSSFAGTLTNSGTITASASGSSIAATAVSVGGTTALTLVNSGIISGTDYGINLSGDAAASTISQNGGTISGGTDAILFSANGDTLNFTGGTLGNVAGSGGTLATVNIQPGAGNSVNYASTMTGVGAVKLNSGMLLLRGGTISSASYAQAAGATLGFTVGTTTGTPAVSGSGSINASGAMTLGGTIEAVLTNSAFKPNTTYTFSNLVTSGSLSGSFASVTTSSPLMTASLFQSGNSEGLNLSLAPVSAVPGLSANQQSLLAAIYNIPNGNPILDQVFLLTPAQLNTALTQLSGSQLTQSNYQPAVTAWQNFNTTLSNRLSIGEGYSGTMTGSDTPGGGVQFAQADTSAQQAQAADSGPLRFAAPVPQQWGAWVRGYGMSATAPATATSVPYSESGSGIIFGADKQMTNQLVAGLAMNISTDKASNVGGGFNLSNLYQGSAYAQYQLDPNWYLNGIAGFGWQTYSSQRVVTLLTTSYDNGSFNGQGYNAYGETGYALRPAFAGGAWFTPYLGLGYLHTHTDGFTENGATALSIQAVDANSLTTTLGLRAATRWQVGASVFQPELRAGWQHEWLDDTATIHAAFAASPASVFTATGTAFSRESFVGGAGITTAIDAATQVFVDYDAKVNGGYFAQTLTGGLRVDF